PRTPRPSRRCGGWTRSASRASGWRATWPRCSRSRRWSSRCGLRADAPTSVAGARPQRRRPGSTRALPSGARPPRSCPRRRRCRRSTSAWTATTESATRTVATASRRSPRRPGTVDDAAPTARANRNRGAPGGGWRRGCGGVRSRADSGGGGRPRRGDALAVLLGPRADRVDRAEEGPPEVGERVLDARGDLGVDGAGDEAVPLERAQRLREDLRRHGTYEVAQLAEPQHAPAQRHEDEQRPLVADPLDDEAARAVDREDVRSTRRDVVAAPSAPGARHGIHPGSMAR